MIQYNLAGEYAALIVVLAVLFSFSKAYDSKTLTVRFLKVIYYVVAWSVLFTIAATGCSIPNTVFFNVTLAYVVNVIYFMLLPAVSVCYLIYTVMLARLRFNEIDYLLKLIPVYVPYLIYLVLLLTNISNGKVFSISETLGYVRGDWYQLPFLLAGLNLLFIFATVVLNRKRLHKEALGVFVTTMVVAGLAMALQAANPNTPMTGILHTTSILAIHLYIQNRDKSIDQLTGLHNKMTLRHQLGEHIKQDEDFSLYIFSLRGFKMINERYGLAFGDKILMRVADFCTQHFPYQSVFRYDGDEFALLLHHNSEANDQQVRELRKSLEQPLLIDDNQITLDVIYARVDYRLFGYHVNDLISAADYSISTLKEQSSKDAYLYDTSVVEKIIEKNHMVEQLKKAISQNRFEIHYQPIYSASQGRFTQAEALVRMRDDQDTLLYPGKFIELAEKTGLIVHMTYIVLDKVCADLRKLIDSQGDQLLLDSVSVNFPYLQFNTPDMHCKVEAILEKYQIPPHMIKIEITERALISDSEMVKSAMEQMNRQGFAFELDDFGINYSNMETFLKLPLNIIKIDRSLLLAAYETEENMRFFQHLAAGIQATERVTIIEGVEEREQLDFVLGCGCEYVQGFFFSKPLPFGAFEAFISSRQQATTLAAYGLS